MRKIIDEYLNGNIKEKEYYKKVKGFFEDNYITLNYLKNIELYLKEIEKKEIFQFILDVYLNISVSKGSVKLIEIFEILDKFGIKLSNNLSAKILSQWNMLSEFNSLIGNIPKNFEENFKVLESYYKLYLSGYDYDLKELNRILAGVNCDDVVDIKYYKNQVYKIPVLTPNEETSLFIKKELGYPDAFEYLVLSNLRLVLFIANDMHFNNKSLCFEDLVQNGNIALMKAVSSFNFEYGCKFSTYAVNTIRNNVERQLSKEQLINVSEYLKQNSSAVEVMNAKEPIISLDDSYYKDSSNESIKLVDEISNEMSMYDSIKATDVEAIDNVFSEEFNKLFDNIYYISEIDKKILFLHFGYGYSVNECIKILNLKISRQAVDQRLEKVKTKLKNDHAVRRFYNNI